jgi:ABC-type transport system substrate-binding protein/class 3 adenylate cyclase
MPEEGATREKPAPAREERKIVTALFADLVGSTALGEKLDPEEVKLIVGEAVARIVNAVEELGGTVKDLAGDGVLALFGAPTTHEDDEERAVRAALKIVDELGAYSAEVARGWGIEGFGVRVGVHTGPVVLGEIGAGQRVEYAAFGDTINTAARLESAAKPSSVLVSEETRRRIDLLFTWGEDEELELKGKAETVRASRVAAPRADAGEREAREHVPFVGREAELSEGRETIDRLLQGAGAILFVTGEPGIGKSRLLHELKHFFETSPSEGGRRLWIEGRCASYADSTPYWPFRDLLRSWLGVGSEEAELRVRVALRRRVEELFADRALEVYAYLGSLLGLALEPDAQERLAELSPEALQYRTFEVVEMLLARLAEDGPVAVAIEDLHWADPTSVELFKRLLPMVERSAVLLLGTGRPERDHPFWKLKEAAAHDFPHRTQDLELEPLSGRADVELLASLVGSGTLPSELEERILAAAEGNPFFLEELVRSLADAGALVPENGGWKFDHEVPVEVPPTVERVILARIDRLPRQSHDLLVAASVLGRQFSLPLLEGVSEDGSGLQDEMLLLQRLDLIREARRWPQPEYQFKHALIQETAYRTVLAARRTELHRKAAVWLESRYAGNEDEVLGLLAHHWLAAADEEKAVAYLARAGDKAREDYALDEAIDHYRALLPLLEARGERQEVALVLFKLALALHTALRFAEANETYQRAFEHWTEPEAGPEATATLRMAATYVPRNGTDPGLVGWWPDIQLCMQLFDRLVEAWPERTIVPALAERWEISDDGLRYVFHLREGLQWSDGEPLTAHDVEYGIKRVLNPESPGGSVSVYFVLENAQDYFFGRGADLESIGVRALDDRMVEFRLVAPAPYFMSVVNRPDGGPAPRHAIESDPAEWTNVDRQGFMDVERERADWTDIGRQVVSGAFRVESADDDRLVLVRNENDRRPRRGNVARVEYVRASADEAFEPFERGELEMIRVMYTPRFSDQVRTLETLEGPLTWFGYLGFDHDHPPLSLPGVRKALALSIDRDALAEVAPANFVIARGGIVPPALHGHTPEIALPFDAAAARDQLGAASPEEPLRIAAHAAWEPLLEVVSLGWRETLGLETELHLFDVDEQPQRIFDLGPVGVFGWLPGYPDPEYMLRLLLHSEALTNAGRYANPAYDELIEAARHAQTDRERLSLFHEADRFAVAEDVALIPLVYGRSTSFVQPNVKGWWEFAKTSAPYADLTID